MASQPYEGSKPRVHDGYIIINEVVGENPVSKKPVIREHVLSFTSETSAAITRSIEKHTSVGARAYTWRKPDELPEYVRNVIANLIENSTGPQEHATDMYYLVKHPEDLIAAGAAGEEPTKMPTCQLSPTF